MAPISRLGWIVVWLAAVLAACATQPRPVVAPPAALFDDARFAPASERIDAADVFALSDAMLGFLRNDMASDLRMQGRQQGLLDALYSRGKLRLEYDTGNTRNAAQAFDARAGNCLSLVVMTAAFAKELGLSVRYQSAITEETWSRSGDIYLSSGHVNVTLGRRLLDAGTQRELSPLTIDFLPAGELRGLRTYDIEEATVIAMFMNNRAAESMVEGRLDDAYWWARVAIAHDASFMSAYNTLGVVYLRHGDAALAERAFAFVLAREPANTPAMSNQAKLFEQTGRLAEAAELRRTLARIEPQPPFHFFALGKAAMARGDYQAARAWFEKEVDRADYYHEFHFWLALADFNLGDIERARKHLKLAMERSTTRGDRDLYAAKLARLRAQAAR